MWKKEYVNKILYKWKEIELDKYTKKHIALVIYKGIVKAKLVIISRDTYIVSVYSNGKKIHHKKLLNIFGAARLANLLKIRVSKLFAKDTGSLFKKYKVPSSIRNLCRTRTHHLCMQYRFLKEIGLKIDDIYKLFTNRTSFSLTYKYIPTLLSYNYFFSKSVKQFLKLLPYKSRFNFIDYTLKQGNYYLSDTVNAFNEISAVDGTLLDNFNWNKKPKDIHDDLSRILVKINLKETNNPIDYFLDTLNKFKDLENNLKIVGGELNLASKGSDLIEWGEHFSHCIGNYVKEAYIGAKNDSNFFLKLKYKGYETACWLRKKENKWQIMQMFGKYNDMYLKNVEEKKELSTLILESLNEEKVLC